MRTLLATAIVATLAGSVLANDLGNQAPAKLFVTYPENIPDPERQGGDTMTTATVIGFLPYYDSGTTVGYNNDYDAVCPYSGSTAPDVVYVYNAAHPIQGEIDLCGSDYDTKLYVYDAAFNLIACNDDDYFGPPCGQYVSRIDFYLAAAGTYYIIVDGYGSAAGNYVLEINPWLETCYFPYPDNEGEPPLTDDYVDSHNGGCNTPPDYPFQEIAGDANGEAFLSGEGGWYGGNFRDTDWFILTMGMQGAIEITACALQPTYLFELGPQDCEAIAVVQSVTADGAYDVTMTITGYAAMAPVWFWAGSTVFSPPQGGLDEYGYNVWFAGLAQAVATQPTTWSRVKALYD
jgi:hypothetical protein